MYGIIRQQGSRLERLVATPRPQARFFALLFSAEGFLFLLLLGAVVWQAGQLQELRAALTDTIAECARSSSRAEALQQQLQLVSRHFGLGGKH